MTEKKRKGTYRSLMSAYNLSSCGRDARLKVCDTRPCFLRPAKSTELPCVEARSYSKHWCPMPMKEGFERSVSKYSTSLAPQRTSKLMTVGIEVMQNLHKEQRDVAHRAARFNFVTTAEGLQLKKGACRDPKPTTGCRSGAW